MKIIGIITAVTLFVYCGFQHCIANMFYFGMAFNWNVDMLWNLLIVILTNSIGALLTRCIVHLVAIISVKKEADNEEFGESFGTGEAADKRRSELRFEKQRKEFNEKN